MDAFLSALPLVAAPSVLLAIAVGAFIGLVFGAMPGLTFSLALAVVLPMTFTMDMISAVGMLLGTYIGGMTGGSVAAILIGIPGTPSAAATVFDGYPLARAGKAGLALGTAVVVSVFGGLFSLAVMIVSVDLVARMAIRFGPAEIFALVLFGLSTICGLAEKSLLRGLIAGVLGLLVMTIGLDPYAGIPRMTFGTTTFMQGSTSWWRWSGCSPCRRSSIRWPSGAAAARSTSSPEACAPNCRRCASSGKTSA
jgi:putative tricarboxylic transport membrane protein